MEKEVTGCFYNDPIIDPKELVKISVLNEKECADKWTKYVSDDNRHLMLMKKDEWPSQLLKEENFLYKWINDRNEDHYTEFQALLKSIGIPVENYLYLFWMKEVGIKTKWGVFINNWSNFLYEDEGCILVLPEFENALVLSNGNAWYGPRRSLKPDV